MTGRNLPVPLPGTDIVPDGWWETAVMPWADEQTNGKDLRDAAAKLAGLAEAYRLMDADAIEFEKARRYLELRLGELLGKGVPGQHTPPSQACEGAGLNKDEVYRFRKLAEYRRAVIAWLRKATREEDITRAAIMNMVVPVSRSKPSIPDPEGDILAFADLCNRVVIRSDAAIFAFWANPDVPIPDIVMESMQDAVKAIRHVIKEMDRA